MTSYTANGHGAKVEVGQASKEASLNELHDIQDAMVAGYVTKSVAGSSNVPLVASEARARVIELTGTLTGNINVDLPSIATAGSSREVIVYNNTSGAFTVTFRYNGGAGVVIPQGLAARVYHNGTNLYLAGPFFKPQTSFATATPTVPAAAVYHSVNQSLANTTQTAIAFDSERFDTDTIHDPAANTRLTCKTPGLYHISGSVAFAANGAGIRQVVIRLNGSTAIAVQTVENVGASVDTALGCDVNYFLAANDYLQLEGYQSSGGALNVLAANNYSPVFSMVRLG